MNRFAGRETRVQPDTGKYGAVRDPLSGDGSLRLLQRERSGGIRSAGAAAVTVSPFRPQPAAASGALTWVQTVLQFGLPETFSGSAAGAVEPQRPRAAVQLTSGLGRGNGFTYGRSDGGNGGTAVSAVAVFVFTASAARVRYLTFCRGGGYGCRERAFRLPSFGACRAGTASTARVDTPRRFHLETLSPDVAGNGAFRRAGLKLAHSRSVTSAGATV